ncbi:MAG: UDP-N-acetylmuramate dehydrogenase [Anaerolineales bacterium]|nr:MAG: UDP-N-acetylmuramate dehydrogenase [Anaerolineales bacterium]
MKQERLSAEQHEQLERLFGDALRCDVPLAPYTSSRIGGAADFLLEPSSATLLGQTARDLWAAGIPFRILGGGSNVLVADNGVREVVLLNKARERRFYEDEAGPQIWAESGATLGTLARLAAERGWSGLEWAATVPGTLGGAVVGNAGAHGSDISSNLSVAEILQQGKQAQVWACEQLEYDYRSSRLKRDPGQFVVLTATLGVERSTAEACKQRMREYSALRTKTQPAGASMGSMFKNPPGNYAGRLIEQAGLKGYRQGRVQISEQHANFFINHGDGIAQDVWRLITEVRERVFRQFDIRLELEIELLGDWAFNGDQVLEG